MKSYIVSKVTHYCNISVGRCSSIDRQIIDFYDLTFVLSGSMTYIADGKTYILKKNDAIFLKPETARTRLEGNEPVRYVSFNFHILPECELSFPTYIKNCISADIKKIISAFPQSHLSPYYHSRQKAANLLNYILFDIEDILNLKSNNEHILNITKYIGEHITDNLSLAEVSGTLGLSKEHVSYLFKREMGITFTDYINRQKMLAAKELILNHEMRLTDIAGHLGYNNYSYFSRVFKRYFDVTPISMRNKL